MKWNQDNFEIIKKDLEYKNLDFSILSLYFKKMKAGNNSTRERTYVRIKHNICGNIFEKQSWRINEKLSCPKCVFKKKDSETFANEFKKTANNEYILLSEYELVSKKVKVKHLKCGHIYEVTPNKWLSGRRCPNCFGPKKMDKIKFKERFDALSNNEYELLSDYVNTYTKVKVKHLKCGHIYEVTPNKWLSGRRCPKCRESHGEKEIDKYLTSKNINFKRQVKFRDCKDITFLPFDFGVYDKFNNLLFLIEFDGIFHFKKRPEDIDGSEFEKTKKHDAIKNNYCEKNNIKLLRINDIKLIQKSIEKMFNDYPDRE